MSLNSFVESGLTHSKVNSLAFDIYSEWSLLVSFVSVFGIIIVFHQLILWFVFWSGILSFLSSYYLSVYLEWTFVSLNNRHLPYSSRLHFFEAIFYATVHFTRNCWGLHCSAVTLSIRISISLWQGRARRCWFSSVYCNI